LEFSEPEGKSNTANLNEISEFAFASRKATRQPRIPCEKFN
jgi:hypothetical protein